MFWENIKRKPRIEEGAQPENTSADTKLQLQ